MNNVKVRKAQLCTNLHMRMAGRQLSNQFDRALKDVSISGTQFSILMTIARESEPSITRIAALLRIERTALSRNLDLIHKQGLIRIDKAAAGNVRLVTLTKAGQKKINEAFPIWEKRQDSVKKKLGVKKWKLLIRLLGELKY